MRDFDFYTPTKVVFGKSSVERTGQLVKTFGGTKVLVHFGGGSVKRTGLLDRVLTSLTDAGIEYVLLGGVKPNPRLSLVYENFARGRFFCLKIEQKKRPRDKKYPARNLLGFLAGYFL